MFSSVFVITEKRDMGLYEVPLSMSFFLERDYVGQFPYVRYYVVAKSSFKQTREVC